jgi:hypothetical protein
VNNRLLQNAVETARLKTREAIQTCTNILASFTFSKSVDQPALAKGRQKF